MTTRRLLVLAFAVLVGCLHAPPPLPPGPSGLQRIVVEQPVNRTGGDLVVDSPGLLESLIRERPSSVPDVLAEDLSNQLVLQGFRLAKRTEAGAPVLRTEIRRWEPYPADYSTVTVDLTASLIEPESGRTLWTATRSGWAVRTTDARSRSDASRMASAAAAEALLAGWQPAAP